MNKNTISRRSLLAQLSGTALTAAPLLQGFAAEPKEKKLRGTPKRFVFVIRSNGILTREIQPIKLNDLVKVRSNGKGQSKLHQESLKSHQLSAGLKALTPFKDRLTIFQGLSGRMCSGSHQAHFGALGAYKSAGESPPTLPTVDGLLAKGLDAPFRHLGFTMERFGPQIVYPNLSAIGPRKPLPYYADPLTAFRDLFGTVVSDKQLKAALLVDKNLLDFMIGDVKKYQKKLPAHEKEKLDHYLAGFESLQERNKKIAKMEAQLKKAAPELSELYRSEIETERLDAHFQLATSALVGGLSQVISIRADHMGMRLTGLGLGTKTVHHIGHMIEGKSGGGGGEDFDDGKGEFATRELIMKYHMNHIAQMAKNLSSIPEGDGTMLDNTLILYLSDHGDRHHSKFYEWPMVALGNIGGAFKTGQYIHFPGYSFNGHRTISNLYLSLLHAAGLPQKSFGHLDRVLPATIDQASPLSEWV